MKLFISSVMCFFLLLCANLVAEDCNPKEHAKSQIAFIDHMMNTYEFEGADYKVDFNYHVGFLLGQRKAYQDMIDHF